MSASSWASPRDEFPESVHALMSLWGGFVPPTDYTDPNGLEKRLELDFTAATAPAAFALPTESIIEILAAVEEMYVSDSAQEGLRSFTFTHSVVVLTRKQLVITSSSNVRLHHALSLIMNLFAREGVKVDWASFRRKNTTSPWSESGETSDIMAQEYADLKAAFPSGKSFLTGSVDGDHFFHFVYDTIHRNGEMAESDVQVNAFFYEMAGEIPEKAQQQIVPLPGSAGEYEIFRTFANRHAMTFETNASNAVTNPERVSQLLDKYRPARFTVMALQDIESDGGKIRKNFSTFDGYRMVNRSVNRFGEGYAFHQMVFAAME